MKLWRVLLLSSLPLLAGRNQQTAIAAHADADQILFPRFAAAFNEWRTRHPVDHIPGSGDHRESLDTGDRDRWEKARIAFHALEKRMKEAGY